MTTTMKRVLVAVGIGAVVGLLVGAVFVQLTTDDTETVATPSADEPRPDEDQEGDDEGSSAATTSEAPATTAPPTTSSGLSPEDDAACRYLLEAIEAPGGYDAVAVFSRTIELAGAGSEVQAAAQRALDAFRQNGQVDATTAADLVLACGPALAAG